MTFRVQNAIIQESLESSAINGLDQLESRNINRTKKKARRILQEMVANVSPSLIR